MRFPTMWYVRPAKAQTSLCRLIKAFATRLNYSMIVKLTEQHLEFLSSKGDCTGRSESTLVTCWKSHVMAQISKDLGQF